VDIDGAEYFIDTLISHRDEAYAFCESIGMNLVVFENGREKFDAINTWLDANGSLKIRILY